MTEKLDLSRNSEAQSRIIEKDLQYLKECLTKTELPEVLTAVVDHVAHQLSERISVSDVDGTYFLYGGRSGFVVEKLLELVCMELVRIKRSDLAAAIHSNRVVISTTENELLYDKKNKTADRPFAYKVPQAVVNNPNCKKVIWIDDHASSKSKTFRVLAALKTYDPLAVVFTVWPYSNDQETELRPTGWEKDLNKIIAGTDAEGLTNQGKWVIFPVISTLDALRGHYVRYREERSTVFSLQADSVPIEMSAHDIHNMRAFHAALELLKEKYTAYKQTQS